MIRYYHHQYNQINISRWIWLVLWHSHSNYSCHVPYFVKNCSSVLEPGRISVSIFQLISTEEISDMFTWNVNHSRIEASLTTRTKLHCTRDSQWLLYRCLAILRDFLWFKGTSTSTSTSNFIRFERIAWGFEVFQDGFQVFLEGFYRLRFRQWRLSNVTSLIDLGVGDANW